MRNHLTHLEREGFIETSLQPDGVGRPAKRYALSSAAEGLFPKRYEELLSIILAEAQDEEVLEPLMTGVVDRLVEQLSPNLTGNTPRAKLMSLIEQLDYGEMLAQLRPKAGGNCAPLTASTGRRDTSSRPSATFCRAWSQKRRA